MKSYNYNKDMFEFYLSDDTNVQAWQVENGEVWTLELFPANQSEESFERGQYDGVLTFHHTEDGKVVYDWNIVEYPENWNDQLQEELKQGIENEINDIKLLSTVDFLNGYGIIKE